MSAADADAVAVAQPTDAGACLRLDDALLVYHVADVKRRLLVAFEELSAGDTLTLDCSALGEFDGAGLQLLVEAARALEARRVRVRLLDLAASMAELLQGSGYAGWFDLERSTR